MWDTGPLAVAAKKCFIFWVQFPGSAMTATPKAAKPPKSYHVSVDDLVCDGCGICVFFCKPGVFELSHELISRGVFPALPLHSEACNNCRLCELGCPQLAILVTSAPGEEG